MMVLKNEKNMEEKEAGGDGDGDGGGGGGGDGSLKTRIVSGSAIVTAGVTTG